MATEHNFGRLLALIVVLYSWSRLDLKEISILCDDTETQTDYDIEQCGYFVPKINRLPDDIKPIHYDVFISVHNEAMRYEGGVRMVLTAKPLATNFIVLHAAPDLDIKRAQVFNIGSDLNQDELDVKCTRIEPENQILIIEFDSEMQLSPGLLITLIFEGPIRTETRGLFHLDSIFLTRLESNLTRYFIPSFDESRFKATFKLTVERDADLMCFSNTRVEEDTPLSNEFHTRSRIRFKITPRFSPYQLSLVVGDLRRTWITKKDHIDIQLSKPRNVDFYILPPAQAVEHLVKVSRFYGLAYPADKIDIIELASHKPKSDYHINYDSLGIMILFKPAGKSKGISSHIIDIILQSSRHYLSTILDLDLPQDSWLLDGLSSWLSIDGISLVNGLSIHHGETLAHFHRDSLEYFARDDAIQIIDAQDKSFKDHSLTNHQFWKVSAIFKNLNQICRHVRFRSIFSQLAQEYVDGFNDANLSLIERISRTCSIDIKSSLMDWLTVPGVLVIGASFASARDLKMDQKMLLLQSSDPEYRQEYQPEPMDIDISAHFVLTYKLKERRYFSLRGPVGYFQIPPKIDHLDTAGCIKFNQHGLGFYVVKYSKELITKLEKGCDVVDTLSVLDRGNLLFDSLFLFKGGLVEPDYPFDFMVMMHKETHWFNIHLIYKSFEFLRRTFRGDETFENLFVSVGLKLFGDLDVNDLLQYKSAPDTNKYKSVGDIVKLSIELGHEAIMDKAIAFLEFVKDPEHILNLNPTVVQAVISTLAKRNELELLFSLQSLVPDESFGRALAFLPTRDSIIEAWTNLMSEKTGEQVIVSFLKYLNTRIIGKEFLSQYLDDNIAMGLVFTMVGAEGAAELIKEFCSLPKDTNICPSVHEFKSIFSDEQWSKIMKDIHDQEQDYTRLQLDDIETLERKMIAFINE